MFVSKGRILNVINRVCCAIAASLLSVTSVAAQNRSVINVSGLEYNAGDLSATYGVSYTAPSDATLSAIKAERFWGIRLPVALERLQPDPAKAIRGELVPAEAQRVLDTVRRARQVGLATIVDLHNFGQYWGNDVDLTGNIPSTGIRDMYIGIVGAVARLLRNECFGFELMNEPKNLDPGRLQPLMQEAVNAARNAGFRGTIFVPTAWWSSANDGINIIVNDPLNDLVYDVHAYGDGNNSGTYEKFWEQDVDFQTGEMVNADTILNRVKIAVEHARQLGVRVFVGEIGAPVDDPRRIQQVKNAARYLAARGVDWAYWTAGDWSSNDQNSTQLGLNSKGNNGARRMVMALPNNR